MTIPCRARGDDGQYCTAPPHEAEPGCATGPAGGRQRVESAGSQQQAGSQPVQPEYSPQAPARRQLRPTDQLGTTASMTSSPLLLVPRSMSMRGCPAAFPEALLDGGSARAGMPAACQSCSPVLRS